MGKRHHQERLHDRLVSPWYAGRALLGPRRHAARIVKKIDPTTSSTTIPTRLRLGTGGIYSGAIFNIDPRSHNKILKTTIGYYATALQAHRSCQEAQEARDARHIDSSALPSHLKLRIVSQKFKTLDQAQRIVMVYKSLIAEHSLPLSQTEEKKSILHVASLPHRQSLLKELPFSLLLELREDEAVPPGRAIEPLRQAMANKDPIFRGMNHQLKHLTMRQYERSSALAAAEPLIDLRRRDLATSRKKRAAAWSKPKRQKDTCRNPLLRRRRHQGKEADTAVEVSAKLAISALTLCDSATRMQRMWRRNHLKRMETRWKQWNRAALGIQCLFRGAQGRHRSIYWRKTRDAAIITLQRYIRGKCARRFVARRRHQWTQFATLVQKAARVWIARRYLRWMRANAGTATVIQRLVRGYLGRCIYRETLRKKEDRLRHSAALRIQARARAFCYSTLLREIHLLTIEVPRIVRIQACWRKCLAINLRNWRNAATTIQRHVRGVSIRRTVQAHRYNIHRHRCATMIQSIVGGFLDRCFAIRTRRINHYYAVVIPSAVKIQRVFRGWKERLRQTAAKTIQTAHRRSKAHRYIQEKWLNYVAMLKRKSALRIQTWFRSRLSRCRYVLLLDHERSRRLGASRTIIRCWRTYKKRQKTLLQKEASDYKRSQDTIETLQREQAKIRNRITSANDEIEANRIAIIEAEKRLRAFNGKLAEATSLAMGSIESFSKEPDAAERSRLQLQFRDVTDSIADCKDIIRSSRTNIDRLQQEQDKLYVNDLDRLCRLEHEEHENQRRAELQRCMARKEREWRERVRFERTKWAVKLPPKAKEIVCEPSDTAYHRTISTSKRRELAEEYSRNQQAEAQKRRTEAILERHRNGAENKAVRQLYDRIFRDMNSIMKSN